MQVISNSKNLRRVISGFKVSGNKIGFAPTMGALHAGHMSLFDIARKNSDKVVASIFVNPAQFAPGEDFESYPRNEEEDLKKLEQQNIDIVYIPSLEDIYPEGFDIKISTGKIGQQLEGISRPHFFDGVALIVTKLFMQVLPDIAVFGEKDFQQLHIIRKLVRSFDIPTEVIGAPIIRENNGLAMSSRNAYLSNDELDISSSLFQNLQYAAAEINAGSNLEKTLKNTTKNLLDAGFKTIDYLELRDAQTLQEVTPSTKQRRLLTAAYLDKIRLIDNIAV